MNSQANSRPADSLKIALAQLNPTVGDVAGNAEKVRRAILRLSAGRELALELTCEFMTLIY